MIQDQVELLTEIYMESDVIMTDGGALSMMTLW